MKKGCILLYTLTHTIGKASLLQKCATSFVQDFKIPSLASWGTDVKEVASLVAFVDLQQRKKRLQLLFFSLWQNEKMPALESGLGKSPAFQLISCADVLRVTLPLNLSFPLANGRKYHYPVGFL